MHGAEEIRGRIRETMKQKKRTYWLLGYKGKNKREGQKELLTSFFSSLSLKGRKGLKKSVGAKMKF